MDKSLKRKLAVGAGAALAVAGGGGAIAATQLGSPGAESKAIVDDAAKQLGIQPSKLTDALKKALENQVDAAVADGRLTKQQGEELKARIEADDFPLFAGPLFGHRGGFTHFRDLDAAASYLGLTEAQLRERLESGKTLAQVAKDEGKSVDGLVDALVAEAKKDLDAAVGAGRLTKEREQEILNGLKQRITDMVNGTFGPGGPGFRGEHRFGGGPPALAPPSGDGWRSPAA